jgi:hypothetical protein
MKEARPDAVSQGGLGSGVFGNDSNYWEEEETVRIKMR